MLTHLIFKLMQMSQTQTVFSCLGSITSSLCVTKFDVKKETGVYASLFPKTIDVNNLKLGVDKLDLISFLPI